MAFASLDGADDNEPLAEINMVPLIDVMLVLLIIFMVTAHLLDQIPYKKIKVDLPKASSSANITKPDNVQLAIDAGSQLFWNGEAVSAGQFAERLKAASLQQPQPELHIRAERTTPYEKVAQVMSEAARQGLVRIGFVTDPTATR